jgi:hypothetical protein
VAELLDKFLRHDSLPVGQSELVVKTPDVRGLYIHAVFNHSLMRIAILRRIASLLGKSHKR